MERERSLLPGEPLDEKHFGESSRLARESFKRPELLGNPECECLRVSKFAQNVEG